MTTRQQSGSRRVALIGAGFIAGVHAAALKRLRNVRIVAVVDPVTARAEEIAGRLSARHFANVSEMLGELRPDAAHVLTPPPTHLETAEPLLAAGIDILLEKPMAQTADECGRLEAAARAGRSALVINHNFLHHPVFQKSKSLLEGGAFGRLLEIQMRYAAPLRQLASRQFGHWMFASPRNLLLEQVVHPLSLIDELLEGIQLAQAVASEPCRPAEGIAVRHAWSFSMAGSRGRGNLSVTLGASFPSWTFSLLCDDGIIDADMLEGRVIARRPHPAIAPTDYALRNAAASIEALSASVKGLAAFAGEIVRLTPAADGFNRSMNGSVAAFHRTLDTGSKQIDGRGGRLVSICEDVARDVPFDPPRPIRAPAASSAFDVAVIGGTGFVGSWLVSRLLTAGLRVAVLARGTSNLPSLFHRDGVGVFKGSMSDPAALAAAVGRARQTVILAHGGGGPTRAAVESSMVGGARATVSAAIRANAERIIYVSSSAALYLGDPAQTVTSNTPPDEQPDQRGDYARAKILAERAVRELGGPGVVIMRPAIVVGEGASPWHSALGAFENESHCVGWNDGRNALPFVLVSDVAEAITRALDAPFSDVAGGSFNLVGDVRWNARRYIEELCAATGRAVRFHPSNERLLLAGEWAKWIAKRVAGRAPMAPSIRDLKSRGMLAAFDTTQEKKSLGWSPCGSEEEFRRQAIACHADRRG